MHQHSDKHHILRDELFLQIVETEVDGIDGSLPTERREQVVLAVSEKLQGEFEELLMTGELRPEIVTVRIREEALRAVYGEPGSIAA